MKSLLVDALRQANSDKTATVLTDSGSFDTTQQEVGAIANDENGCDDGETVSSSSPVDAPEQNELESADEDLDEFELVESTGRIVIAESDVAPDETHALSVEKSSPRQFEQDVILNAAAFPPSTLYTSSNIARYSPFLCIALAVSAAGAWFLYQYIDTRASGATLGTGLIRSSPMIDFAVDERNQALPRFPFIESGHTKETDDGAPQQTPVSQVQE